MATFYVGKRSVLKGRNGEVTNTYTGKVGKYSSWDLMNTSHVLDGAPGNYHVPGTGYSPHGYQLSRTFRGLGDQTINNSLMSPGLGTRQDPIYFRQGPYLWKGLPSSKVFSGGYGHILDGGPMAEYGTWTNYKYSGVPAGLVFTSTFGHKQNVYGAHYAFMGPTHPYEFLGVVTKDSQPLGAGRTGHQRWDPSVVADPVPSDYGKIPAARATTEHYGFEHTMEWFGVPSAKAL